jgi:mannitol-1-phosphate 5-dehydrogenase
MLNMLKTFVQIGAGNIGRSFIGQIFAQNNHKVIFIEKNRQLVNSLNQTQSYTIIIKQDHKADEIITVNQITAVCSDDFKEAVKVLSDSDIAATSVGVAAIPAIMPIIAAALEKRLQNHPAKPLDIIIAENIRNASGIFINELQKYLPENFPLKSVCGLIETSIGKMVPLMPKDIQEKEPLLLWAEPYNQLILSKRGFKNQIPSIPQFKLVDNIRAFVDRKLFIHNLGHAAAAYLGYKYMPESQYIYEVLENVSIYRRVRRCMQQSAFALNCEYPEDLSLSELEEHIDELIDRFQNKSLGDTIYRVGRDIYRKLDHDDRIIGALLMAQKHSIRANSIVEVLLAGFHFHKADSTGRLFSHDEKYWSKEYRSWIKSLLMNVCHLQDSAKKEAELIHMILDESLHESVM